MAFDGCQALPEMTTTEKVKEMILAPSTELKVYEIVDLFKFLFNWEAREMADIYRKLGELKVPLEETMPQEALPQQLTMYPILFKTQLESTLHMGAKESSGYAQLSDAIYLPNDANTASSNCEGRYSIPN